MLEELLIATPWLGLTMGLLLQFVDQALVLYEGYYYHTGAKDCVEIAGGYRYSSGRPDDPPWRHMLRFPFLGRVAVVAAAVPIMWYVCVRQIDRPEILVVLLGGFVLHKAATALRHFRTTILFRDLLDPEAAEGKIEPSPELVLTIQYIDLYGFTLLYLLLALAGSPWFFFGGALTCLVAARRQRDYVRIRSATAAAQDKTG